MFRLAVSSTKSWWRFTLWNSKV